MLIFVFFVYIFFTVSSSNPTPPPTVPPRRRTVQRPSHHRRGGAPRAAIGRSSTLTPQWMDARVLHSRGLFLLAKQQKKSDGFQDGLKMIPASSTQDTRTVRTDGNESVHVWIYILRIRPRGERAM